jgi:hypothetical protein
VKVAVVAGLLAEGNMKVKAGQLGKKERREQVTEKGRIATLSSGRKCLEPNEKVSLGN